MSFDSDPADKYKHHPCPICDTGSVVFDEEQKSWECDSCKFSFGEKT